MEANMLSWLEGGARESHLCRAVAQGGVVAKNNKEQECSCMKICHGARKAKSQMSDVGETHLLSAMRLKHSLVTLVRA